MKSWTPRLVVLRELVGSKVAYADHRQGILYVSPAMRTLLKSEKGKSLSRLMKSIIVKDVSGKGWLLGLGRASD